ncbi:HypC/HybG/HupF family hydrogenase formation chaperone [Nitrospira sp. Kam-Ns4a]
MCLAVPGKVLHIGSDALRTATVSFGGVTKQVSLALVPEAAIGDYVIVHVGFAISRLDEAVAERTLEELSTVSRQLRHSGERRHPGGPRTETVRGDGLAEG